ncbi:unnamed protein product [Mytilus edulis]|uniref:B box-type domain-containing protein n=1 Tax=Mytilus edulis TaxID=6550 RepID=A0A8S3SAG8_MYTED|nr:unnamed protein product [Mytilus edulis]
MATSTTICGPCSERYTTKPSAYWCSDCQEAICDDCQEHHRVFKATRSHELIPIDKYKSLPSFITDIQQSCTNHNEKYQQYCVAHALPICFKCIKEHQKCNVIPLDEVTNNAKTSGQLQDLETRLVDLLQNIDRIKKDRQANLENREPKEKKFISLTGRPWGITRDHDSLFVCVEGRGIYKVNTADYTTSKVISNNLPWFSYLFIFANNIYYSDCSNHRVVCCDHNGSRVWTFADTSALLLPRGITVDNDGHVFVVGEESSNVVIISNDGKHHRQILTDKDGLRRRSAIFFDKQTRKLLVANRYETAFLYNVT